MKQLGQCRVESLGRSRRESQSLDTGERRGFRGLCAPMRCRWGTCVSAWLVWRFVLVDLVCRTRLERRPLNRYSPIEHPLTMNAYFVAASVLSLITWALHTFGGGPATVGPLLKSADIDPVAKYTNYYCWHIVTIVLLAMTVGFALGAQRDQSVDVAILMTSLSGAFAVWSLVLVAWKYRHPWKLPQWLLFLPITALGVLGALAR